MLVLMLMNDHSTIIEQVAKLLGTNEMKIGSQA